MKILIFIVVLIGILAILSPFIVGRSVFDGVVIDHPYERGLSWDETRREKAALGWQVHIGTKAYRVGQNAVAFSVIDKGGRPLPDAQVHLAISRPSSITYDRVFPVVKEAQGRYRAAVQLPLYGIWDLRITIAKEEKKVLFEERIFAQKGEP